jgi:hypothetical protein
MTRKLQTAAALLASSALGLGLAGCKFDNKPLAESQAQPLQQAAATAPGPGPLDNASYNTPADPPAGAAQPGCTCLAPSQAYAYPARASAVSRTIHTAPPSYAFGYEGEQPYAWDVADDGLMFAEPVGASYRYYYYDPGEPYPYFVQDAGYGYAYDSTGALVALFTAAGLLIAADQWGPYEYRAHDWWRRGYALDQTYYRAPRYRVDERVWRERAPAVVATRDRMFRAAAARPAWRQAAASGWADPPRQMRRALPGWNHEQGRRLAQGGAPAAAPAAHGQGRNVAAAAQAQRAPARNEPARVAERGPAPGQHGRAEGRHEGQRRLAQAGPAPHPAAAAHGEGRHDRGHGQAQGRAFAESAQSHGAPAAFHGPAPRTHEAPHAAAAAHGEAHGGGGPHFAQAAAPPHVEGGGHGGGGHGGPPPGQGGGHAAAPQGGGGHGGGKGGGHDDKHQH